MHGKILSILIIVWFILPGFVFADRQSFDDYMAEKIASSQIINAPEKPAIAPPQTPPRTWVTPEWIQPDYKTRIHIKGIVVIKPHLGKLFPMDGGPESLVFDIVKEYGEYEGVVDVPLTAKQGWYKLLLMDENGGCQTIDNAVVISNINPGNAEIIISIKDDKGVISPVKAPLAGGKLYISVPESITQGGMKFDINAVSFDLGDGSIVQGGAKYDPGGVPKEKVPKNMVIHVYKKAEPFHISAFASYSNKNSGQIISQKGEKSLDLTLQKGDIFVHAVEGGFSSLIPGRWSHAGMYIGDSKIIEAGQHGVHIQSIAEWSYPYDYCVAVFRVKGITAQNQENVVNWAKEKNGRMYDYPSLAFTIGYLPTVAYYVDPTLASMCVIAAPFLIFGTTQKQVDCDDCSITIPILLPNPACYFGCRWYYCSELVWAAYKRNGMDLYGYSGVKPGLVLPTSLVDRPELTVDLVGAHIERKPDRLAAYSGTSDYYDFIIKTIIGKTPRKSGSETSCTGVCQQALTSSAENETPTQIITTITDSKGRKMQPGKNDIPNSSYDLFDFNNNGIGDAQASLRDPDEGEFLINLTPEYGTNPGTTYAVSLAAWNMEDYDDSEGDFFEPWDNSSSDMYPKGAAIIGNLTTTGGSGISIPVRIEEGDYSRMIAGPVRGTAPLMVTFLDVSPLDDVTGNAWSFGDGSGSENNRTTYHLYATPGTYTARLEVFNETGERAEASIPIEVYPSTMKQGPVITGVAPSTLAPDSVIPLIRVTGSNLVTGDSISLEQQGTEVVRVTGSMSGSYLIGTDLSTRGLASGLYDLTVTDYLSGIRGTKTGAIRIGTISGEGVGQSVVSSGRDLPVVSSLPAQKPVTPGSGISGSPVQNPLEIKFPGK